MPRGTSQTPARKARGRSAAREKAESSPEPKQKSTPANKKRSQSITNKSGLPEDILAAHLRPVRPHHHDTVVMPASIGTPPRWVTAWLVFSAAVVLWEGLYVLLRGYIKDQGAYAWVWDPYQRYNTRTSYDSLSITKAYFNIADVVITLLYLWFVHEDASFSNVVGILGSAATMYKTSMFLVHEWKTDWAHAPKHQDEFMLHYALPTSLWIAIPALVIFTLSLRIAWRL